MYFDFNQLDVVMLTIFCANKVKINIAQMCAVSSLRNMQALRSSNTKFKVLKSFQFHKKIRSDWVIVLNIFSEEKYDCAHIHFCYCFGAPILKVPSGRFVRKYRIK